MKKKVLLVSFALVLALSLTGTSAFAGSPNEGDHYGQSDLNTDYFTIPDPGGGAQPPDTYYDVQYHDLPAGELTVCLQDVGVNPTTPPSWADDIADLYVDGVYVGTYDSLNNPEPAPGPGPVQCFSTPIAAGMHEIKLVMVYSAIAGSMFAKDIYMSEIRIEADIDIKPWIYPNSVNRGNKGVIPVALLGSDGFDPTALDPATLSFEFCGVAVDPAHDITDPLVFADHIEMANMDAFPDLVLHFNTQDVAAAITGDKGDYFDAYLVVTVSGMPTIIIIGMDVIRIVK
jgi:hypothetical protein